MTQQPRRRRPRRRTTSIRWIVARFNFFSRWISDDISQYIAEWIPLRSNRAKRIANTMRGKVLDYMAEYPELSRQEAIDDVTSEVLRLLDLGMPVEEELRAFISP